jgi:DNA-3-methyladenine glycosylase I
MRTVPHHSLVRCPWAGTDPLYQKYHDTEWGVPCKRDQKLFEFLVLEGMQAGLSWLTVLKKRAAFRRAFKGFDPRLVARFTSARLRTLMSDRSLIRNQLKLNAAVKNARAYLAVQQEYGTFTKYLWQFVGGTPVRNHYRALRQVPARTPLADALSHDLKRRGFSFVGPTICYAYLQAVGVVNDHLVACFRHSKVY